MAENPLQVAISGALEKLMGSRAGATLKMTASEQLRNQLQPNMLISGTVTASLGDNKYNVKFMKESAVVESKTPLAVNELLHGRVVGVGDRIELQRVFKEKANADFQSGKQINWEHLRAAGDAGNRAVQVLENYRVNLSADEQIALAASLRNSTDAQAVVLSAVVLNKMGIVVSSPALNTLVPVLSRTLNERFNLQSLAAHIDFDKVAESSTSHKHIHELANFIASVVGELPESQLQHNKDELLDALQAEQAPLSADSDNSKDDGNSRNETLYFDAKRLLLNTQSDGSVSHRVSVVPFVINDRLVEVDMALFSQRQRQEPVNSIEYKKIALSLDLDMLGKIDIQINMANKNARVSINAENNLVTNELVKYMQYLKRDFAEFRFNLDELSYGTIEKNQLGNVIGSVVEHYITQDSLSRIY